MRGEQMFILAIVGILVTAIIANYFAKKGAHVSIGTPFFKAEIN